MSILDTLKSIFCSKTELVENKTATATSAVHSASSPNTKLQIPEDSTLKRHFISNLQYEIESTMPARPTEATLRRHYDSTVQAKLDNLLS